MRVTKVIKSAEIIDGPTAIKLIDALGARISCEDPVKLTFTIRDDDGIEHKMTGEITDFETKIKPNEEGSLTKVPGWILHLCFGNDKVRVHYFPKTRGSSYRGHVEDWDW